MLATQTLPQQQAARRCAITVDGAPPRGVTRQGRDPRRSSPRSAPAARRGHVDRVRRLDDPRACRWRSGMTVCNMSIEAGARAGHDRARRDDVRLPRGPAAGADAAKRGRRRSRTGSALPSDAGCGVRSRGAARRARDRADGHVGHEPAGCAARSPARARSRRGHRSRRRAGMARALAYMGLKPGHAARPASRSTACSSARAPTAASTICARRPRVAQRAPRGGAGVDRAGLRAGQARGRGRGARPRLPRRRLRVARAPAARCASG